MAWCSRRASQPRLTRRCPQHSCVVGHRHSCGTNQADTKPGSLLHERRRKGKGCKAANGCAHPTLQRFSNSPRLVQLRPMERGWGRGLLPSSLWLCGHRWLRVPCQRRPRGRGWGGCHQNNQKGNQEMLSNTFLSPSPPSICSSKHQAWLHLCCTTYCCSGPCGATTDSHFVKCCDEGRKLQVTEYLNQIVLSKGI